MNRLSEYEKLDVALVPASLASTNATGRYFDLSKSGKALFVLQGGAIAAGGSVKMEIFEATDADGTSAAEITTAEVIVAANVLVTKTTVALAAVGTGDIVTINGLAFTKGSTLASARTFADAAGLVTCVNDATYGVPNVKASDNSTTVTLWSPNGVTAITITKTDVGGTVTLATVEYIAYSEINPDVLTAGFTHVAAKVTTTSATSVCGVLLARGANRYKIAQAVGASAVI